MLDQRLAVRDGVRRERRRRSTRSCIRRCSKGCWPCRVELALGIVRGGEGATKLIAVTVRDARTVDDARQVARTIANSPLVKTAVHGADPNWGRIVAAAGRAGVRFDVAARRPCGSAAILLFENGLPHDEAAPQAAEHAEARYRRDRSQPRRGGDAAATIWGCDLSAEYVRINGEYRT